MTNDNAKGDSFQVGETRVVGEWRIWRGASMIQATHLRNAGKRGKRCAVVTLEMYRDSDNSRQIAALLMVSIAELADKDPSHPFADPDYMATCFEARGITVDRSTSRGVDIAPAGLPELRFASEHVSFSFETDGFSIKNLDDHFNEPTIMDRCSKRDCLKAYKWAKANAARLVAMSFSEVARALESIDVGYHQYCAID